MTATRGGLTRTVSVEDLQQIVGAEHARAATDGDEVDGVPPRLVVQPGSVEEVSAVTRLATDAGLKVAPRGGGTKLGWGNPPEALDLVIGTRRLDRVVEHSAGDLVTTVQAGVRLEDLQRQLADSRQMLALDPPGSGCTVGGVIATNASGPYRLRYGTVRDLLIGITVVLADGTVAKSGGKVVKNVAGYDLGKLYTGSLGTLGVVVEATFRLHPLPEASRTVLARVGSLEKAAQLLRQLAGTALVPSAVELEWGGGEDPCAVAVLFEGIEQGVEAQAAAAEELVRAHGESRTLGGEDESELWNRLRTPPWESGDGLGLKLASPPTELPALLRAAMAEARASGTDALVRAHAAVGVATLGVSGGDPGAGAAMVPRLRALAGERKGTVVVLDAPPELKRQVDAWGPVGDALPLMRRVKERFDPQRLLNPGRFVGGI